MDGGGITETELRTLKYIRQNYNFTPNAAAWFTGKLPAIEQEAVHAVQFYQTDAIQQSEPPDQSSSPLPEQDPSIVTTPQPDEATPAEKPSERIPHVIWGVLLFVSILISVALYQESDK